MGNFGGGSPNIPKMTNLNAKPTKHTTSEARTQPKQDQRRRETADADKKLGANVKFDSKNGMQLAAIRNPET